MKHPQAEILKAYAEDTSVEIERRFTKTETWVDSGIDQVMYYAKAGTEFRLKPAMRSITLTEGTVVEWPEPMRVAPKDGTPVYLVVVTDVNRMLYSSTCSWHYAAIDAGFCHLTEEAFEAHYGQSFTDKDWRNEASTWAAAWGYATRQAASEDLR